ncbi:hypothetical protein RHGRI_014543 [Rhododendron griersonianum]|uniref:Uncharacterized protein n=1 Tax=Rhododendron griersonianum TaxID=479676 RepID=A0AAV6KA35_9ERIC|nr:hypothetical protein RHGRI_014543 [Rhododendron griersonianum]
MQEQKIECDIVPAPDTEVVPFSEELAVQDQSFIRSDGPKELTLDQDFDEVFAYLNEQVATTDDDVIVLKSNKRVRTELVEENKMDCDVVAAPETKVVPFSEELFEQEQRFTMSNDTNELIVEELEAIWEQEEQDQSFIMSDGPNEFRLDDLDEGLAYLNEAVSVVEQQESLGLDYEYDDFGNISLTTVVPSGLALASAKFRKPME